MTYIPNFRAELALAGGASKGPEKSRASKPKVLSALEETLSEPPSIEEHGSVFMPADIPKFHFALQVSGWSAEKSGIADNDIVLCLNTNSAFSPQAGYVIIVNSCNLKTRKGIHGDWKCLRVVEKVHKSGDLTVMSQGFGSDTPLREVIKPEMVVGHAIYSFPSNQLEAA